MIKIFLTTIIFTLIGFVASAQTIAGFNVKLKNATNGIDVSASVNLDDVTFICV